MEFENTSVTLFVLNDHAYRTVYVIDGPVTKQEVSLDGYAKKSVVLRLEKNAPDVGSVSIREVFNSTGISVISGLEIPYEKKQVTIKDVAQKITGSSVQQFKNASEKFSEKKFIWYGILGAVFLVGILWLLFPKEKKVEIKNNNYKNSYKKFNKGRKYARKFKYNKGR